MFCGLVARRSPRLHGRIAPDLCGEAGTRRERRYGGGAGGDLGTAGHQLTGILQALQQRGGEAKDAEAAGLEGVIRPFPFPFAFSQLLGNAIAVSALDHRRSKASRASRASSGRELASWILAVRCSTGAL